MTVILVCVTIFALVIIAMGAHMLMDYDNIAGMVLIVCGLVMGITLFGECYAWYASEYRAQVLNKEFGTNYTQQELFWASDVIDQIKHMNRARVEVNGDILTVKPIKELK